MNQVRTHPWLHRFAVFTALATLGLVGMGGLVTSHGVGMAVPDWPTSYGYNMFALPFATWLTGGVFHEHTHRLWASFVGVLVVALTRWLGGRGSRRALLLIGAVELLAGVGLLKLGADWRGAGHFLQGIGGVVLLAGVVWARNERAAGQLPQLGWAAFWLVQLQGLLGGLRVVLDAHVLADVRLGTAFGIFHGCLAQVFLVLLAVIALFTSRWWMAGSIQHLTPNSQQPASGFGRIVLTATALIFMQLLIGATMRHQHAGLAISDFPLAHGSLWPDMSAEAVARYNAQRIEINAANPITATQIALQMTHRLMALAILLAVGAVAWRGRNLGRFRRLGFFWFGLILVQVGLGAWTIWSNKAADVATAHVVLGALSLVTGAVASIITLGRFHQAGELKPADALLNELRAGVLTSPPANP